MPPISRTHSVTITLAAAVALGLTAGRAANAVPLTGSSIPFVTEQPSLGLTYLIRTQDPTNFADIGEVVPFAGGVVPGGYSIANGQVLSIVANPALFAQLGTTFGGNGTSNFALPDLSGRTVVGTGQGAGLTGRALGSVAGATTQTLTTDQLPPFGGASGITTGSRPVPTLQPSLALNATVVTNGFFPLSTGAQVQGPVIGQVKTYAGFLQPSGQVAANGQQLPINQNQGLFSVVGNTYGGNGQISFSLPNLAGRSPTGAGSAPGLTPQALGEAAGSESTMITLANLPPQQLTLPNGHLAALGGGLPFCLRQPTLALQYIIAVQGAFPVAGQIVPDGVPFLGEVSLFAGNVAPAGWDFADGQFLSIQQNPALFAVLGTNFGGNGFSSFELPDLRDRVAVGTSNDVTLGESFGSDTETLAYVNLPQGYPATLPVTAGVPEPPAISVLLVGLVGLACRRRHRQPAAFLSAPEAEKAG